LGLTQFIVGWVKGSWVGLAAVALAACAPKRAEPAASYRLDVTPDAIEVTLRVSGVGRATLTSPGSVERMRVDGLRFEDSSGRAFEPRRHTQTSYVRDETDGREVARTSETFRLDPSPPSFTLRYRVRPGHAESGALAGVLGPKEALFSGDQVFYTLATEPPIEPRLEIGALPGGWVAEGLPVDADGRVHAPGVNAWRALLESPIRLGPPRVDSAPPRDVLDALGDARLLLADLPRGARRIDVSPGPLAVGMDVGPWTPRRRARLGRLLAARSLLPDARALRPEDQWLGVAAPIFLGAGDAWPALSERLAREHATSFASARASLGESFRPGVAGATHARRVRGPLVLGLLDEKLGGSGAGARFLREFLEGPADVRQKGFSAALRARLGDAEALPFLDRFVGKAGPLLGRPSESLPDLAFAPSPGAGPVARTLTILVTGAGRGYLESCGCREVPSGGLARRAGAIAAVRRERADAGGVLVLDAGDFLPYADPLLADDLSRGLEDVVVECLNDMGVAAAAVASNEILAGPERLDSLGRLARFPLLSANLVGAADGKRRWQPASETVGGVAIFGASGVAPARAHYDYVDEALEAAGLALADPVEPLAAAVAASSAPLRIVIGSLAPERVRALVERVPEIDLVVSTDDVLLRGPESAPRGRDASGYLGSTLVIYATAGDVALDRVDLRLDAEGRVAGHDASVIQLVPGTPEDARVDDRVARYRELASAAKLAAAAPPPALPGDQALLALAGNDFTGSAACLACHADAHSKWKSTPHAGALETLRRVRRDLDPSCLACHVTHLRFDAGSPAFEEGVACEACHGPGALHAKEPARRDLLVTPVAPNRCRACHTADRNPSFEGRYAEMLEAIRHWPAER